MRSTHIMGPKLEKTLSRPRMKRYFDAASHGGFRGMDAVQLYAWNAEVAGALWGPLHIYEVVLRNAVSEALTNVYGPNWPWDRTFELSLGSPTGGGRTYNPRRDLQKTRDHARGKIGKIIPEMKFVFWQKMFTSRHDERLWKDHLESVFPNMESFQDYKLKRAEIYNNVDKIRELRNRIAHHEPIFMRNLEDDFNKIRAFVGYRCIDTESWMHSHQKVEELI